MTITYLLLEAKNINVKQLDALTKSSKILTYRK